MFILLIAILISSKIKLISDKSPTALKFTGSFINFSYEKQGDNLKMEWTSFLSNVNPRPLYINVDEVESVWIKKTGYGYEYNGKTIYVTEGF